MYHAGCDPESFPIEETLDSVDWMPADKGVSGQLSLLEKFSEGLTMDLLKG